MTPIQATVIGYSGKPCTLFSAYDEDNLVLVVSTEVSYRRDRFENCLIVTNDDAIERDTLFKEDYLSEAIAAYFMLYQGMAIDGQSSKFSLSEKAQRANPAQSIEKDGMDSNGQRYRISESITCAQIAALATCWQVSQLISANKAIEMADRILELETDFHKGLMAGEIFTI